ncbi:SLAP domain-containing protein [Companilactobacillus huachuanensis]|uniref:SLAP domain-containing protein n=1 Tax=Companilactobacillus huachuanensis TaxID=2559914 RepID=A0ABW1RLZ9_9LACO|nr:SLAP domain-containing protein [Companilactobacillus huachuanensis]
MKKSTSLLFSGLLVSGMVLGAVTTPTTVHADNTATTQAAATVTNNVRFVDQDGNFIANKSLQGVKGAAITFAPDGYATPTNNTNIFGDDNATVTATVNKMVSVKVNYVDQNSKLVNSEVVNGGVGNTVKLTDLPAGCNWVNDAEQTITLVEGKEYNVPVTKKVFNTVIFKTSDNTEVGRAEIFGDKVGDAINLTTSQIPAGYKADTTSLTLQTDNNTQFITVTKNAEASTGTVTVNDKAAQLYSIYGNAITGRTLDAKSSWKIFDTKVIKGKTYYKVATNEWVEASDVTVNNDTTDGVTPFTSNVTTGGVVSTLYDKTGKALSGRALGPNTAWKTAGKMVLNGKTYYQVATNEWVDASTVTVAGETTTDTNVTPSKGVVTINSNVANLYTKGGVAITDRALGPGTKWQTANKMTLNGETYYQVATNEWVKASNLK